MAPEPAGPRRVPPWAVAPAVRGYDVCPAWSRRVPDPYPPRGQGPCAGPLPGLPDGWPGNPRSSPAAACMAGGRAGRTATGRRIPGRPKRWVLRPPGPGRPARGCAPWTTASPGTPSGPGRRRGGLCCRPGRMVFAPRPVGARRASGPGWRGPAAFPGLPGLDLCWSGEESGAVGGVWFLPGVALPPGSGRDPAFPRDLRDGRLSVGSCDD